MSDILIYGASEILPSEYQEVEYLESTGTQYIDTNKYLPTDFDRMLIDGAFTSLSRTYNLNGNCSTTLKPFCSIGAMSSGTYYYGFNSTEASISGARYTVNTRLKWYIGADKAEVRDLNDNVIISRTHGLSLPTKTNSQILFAWRTEYPTESLCYFRMYSTKLYKNLTLAQYLKPCYRKSDNVAGMYDLVSGQFFTNQGTGTFTVGPDVISGIVYDEAISKKEIMIASGIQQLDNTVKFMVNDAVYEACTVKTGNRVSEPSTPTVPQKQFTNWVNSSLVPQVFPFIPTSDTILTATFREEIPAEYQEVEYLYGNEGPWLDLGIKYNSHMSIKLKYSRQGVGTGGSVILSTNTSMPLLYFPALNGATTQDRFVWRRSGYTEKAYVYNFPSYPQDDMEVELDYATDTLKLNGTTVLSGMIEAMGGRETAYDSDGNLCLWTVGSGSYKSNAKVYYLAIRQDGNNIMDLVPCYRKSDSKPGMYDLVSETFFINQATTGDDFTVGPDVN